MQVFISYKSEYHAFARKVQSKLRGWGYQTWLATDNIPKGAYFRHEIQRGLDASDVLVGIVTENSQESREVMAEVDYFLSLGKPLIPLKYDDCKLLYIFITIQWIDFTKDEAQAFNELETRLAELATAAITRKEDMQDRPIPVTESIQPTYSETPPAIELHDETARLNRTRMLQKVYQIWVLGVLEQSLGERGAFDLSLVAEPRATLLQPDSIEPQSTNTGEIIHVFDNVGRTILILGAPGSGKTTLLLRLAQQLIARAELDVDQPIPVIFNLSSWATERAPLAEWLADELHLKYQVPRKVAKEWVEREQLLLLLDGLDEVAEQYRNDCVEAINAFRQQYTMVGLAVCSRPSDHEVLTSKLNLHGAITLQPLSQEQIDGYLSRADLAGLREVMQTDATLQHMARTPFLLNMMVFAYRGASAGSLQLPASSDPVKARRTDLFDRYVEKYLQSDFHWEKYNTSYTLKQTRDYLAWLAHKMLQHGYTVFYIESLQPDWLPSRAWRFRYYVGVGLAFGLVWAGAVGLASGVGWGLVFGLVFGLAFGLRTPTIKLVDAVSWNIIRGGLAFAGGLTAGLVVALMLKLPFGLALTGGLVTGLVGGLRLNENMESRVQPNQGIHRSAINAVRIWFMVWLVLVVGLAGQGVVGLGFAVVLGFLVAAVVAGGLAVIQHVVLRLMLYRSGNIPWNYARFLDYCVSIGLLRKVGGGYIFIHRYLLEYFAELER